jgi:hypothetical protein
MRIPVFRSQAQMSNEAPGRPITARMRAEPFVQAELRKGDVIGEAFSQVQQYSVMRHKAAVEVQMSESLLAAEEEMMNLANRLKESSDIYNVFKPDGSGSWSDNVNDMRERLADSIQSRSARDEFRARFNQSELTKRFQLKGAIDTRVRARAAAAEAARLRAIETELSDWSNATPEDYEMLMLTVRANEDAATRSGTSGSGTSGSGTSGSGTSQTNREKLAVNIANNATQALVFDNPSIAVALAEALDLQDEVEKGTITAEEAYARSGLENNAAYTLFTLQQVPREDALEIIYDTLGRSNRLYEAAERQREEQEERNKASLDRNYRGMFMFADRTKEFTVADLMQVAPSVAAVSGLSATPDAPLTADQAREAFMTYFDTFNYLTPEQRRQVDTMFAATTPSSFATQTNQDVYTDLTVRAQAGSLTMVGLNDARMSITSTDYITLLTTMNSQSDDALADAKRVVQFRFGYDAEIAMDSEAARLAQASYFSIASQLEQMATTRRAEGNPMTRSELNEQSQRLADAQMEIFRVQVRDELRNHIQTRMTNITRMAEIGLENPLADLDAWWASLSAVDQENFSNDYWTHRLALSDFQQRMNR